MSKQPGRPIKMKDVRKVQDYLAKGLKGAQIARVLKTTRQQVNRWTHYIAAGKIPPVDNSK